ncbi:hypothetical protein D9M68_19380 [compost metagenome]
MDFQSTPLGAEAALIAQMGSEAYYSYTATFVTENGSLEAMSVVSVDWIRDYRNAAGDEIQIKLVIPWGKYLHHIAPFKENLKLTVVRKKLTTGGHDANEPILEQTFDAFLPMEAEGALMSSGPEVATEYTADLMGLKTVTVQLQDEVFALIRSTLVGGVFRDSVPFEVLISMLHKTAADYQTDIENAVLGVSAIPPNNKTKRSHLVIPHGTPLVSLANKLQTQFGGIYTADIGCYFQKGFWYVWPLYNYKLYDVAERTAMFIIAPSVRTRGIERTWRLVDKNISILITGGIHREDPSEALLLNLGNGTRFANTDNAMEGFLEISNNKAVAKRTNNANEYDAVARRGRSMTRVSQDTTSTNAFQEASKIAARNGAYLTVHWENSNPDLIIPGMQCEIGFLVNNEVKFLNGVVVHCHALSALSGTGMHQKIHQITTEVVVMVDRLSPEYASFVDEQK